MDEIEDIDFPVVDDHLHLDPVDGRGLEAVEEFSRSGGTHLFVVNKPSWYFDVEVSQRTEFHTAFEATVEICDDATEVLEGEAYPVLGVHPALISRLRERGMSPKEAAELMQEGLEVAAEYVEEEMAVALKSGRPHYDVEDSVWRASNEVMERAFELGADVGCAVQLHAEAEEDFRDVGDLAEDAGLSRSKVVKHYSSPGVEGVVPSIMSREEWLEVACSNDQDFMMETDFLDDPDRPGAVMGPRTVPRRVRSLVTDHRDSMVNANETLPQEVYDVDLEI